MVPQEHDHDLGIAIGAKRRGRRQKIQELLTREQLDRSTFTLHIIDGASVRGTMKAERQFRGVLRMQIVQQACLGSNAHLG